MKDLQEALDWLFGTQLLGIKLGLEGMGRLLSACGLEHLPEGTQLIHVAGTNGKGSTCAMMERMAREGGLRTGLFTSPHLICFHERIRVNGGCIGDDDLLRLICFVRQIIAEKELTPTFFEIVTAITLLYFCEQQCNLIILETGMGGRLDATNALPKDVAVIAPIGLDHMQYLGDTLAAVAGEKAGIIQAGKAVVCARQAAEADAVIKARAELLGSELIIVDGVYQGALALKGPHQRENATLAIAALQALPEFCLSSRMIEGALSCVEWAGRYEQISHSCGLLIVDGAHNEHAMSALVATLKEEQMPAMPCIFAAAADKDLAPLLPLLAPHVSEWILPPLSSPRLLPPEQMRERVSLYSAAPVFLAPSLGEALSHGGDKLVCGSLFLVGELKALLAQESYRKSMQ